MFDRVLITPLNINLYLLKKSAIPLSSFLIKPDDVLIKRLLDILLYQGICYNIHCSNKIKIYKSVT